MSKIYQEIINERRLSLLGIDEELKTFREILRQCNQGKWKQRETKQVALDIIKQLTKEKEDLLCSIQFYQNISPKRKRLSQNKENMVA